MNVDAAFVDAAIAEHRRRFLHYKPHEKQKTLHKLSATCRERLFLAGNRVGKTFGGAHEGAMHLTGIYPAWWEGRRFKDPVDGWAASDTSETTRDILQKEYIGIPDKGVLGAIHPSLIIGNPSARRGVASAVDTVLIKHSSGGVSQLGFKSFDQGRAKFQGTRRHFIHLDEEPPQDVYDECFMRTADTDGSGSGIILMTMTPLGGLTPLISTYTEGMISGEVKDGRVFLQAGWEDNPHLSENERIELAKRFASRPHELEARMKGVPSIGSGMIYPVSETSITCEPFEIPKTWKRCVGLDFGWTNPTAAVWLAHDKDTDIVYVYSVYRQAELSAQTHANNILARGRWIPAVGDPSGQQKDKADGVALADQYAKHGLYFSIADNSVESGIQAVLERLQTGRLKVFSTCAEWFGEWRSYARDEKGKVKKTNDHLMDAMRYAVVSGLGIASSETKGTQDYYGGGVLTM